MKLDYIKHRDYTCEHPVCLVFDYYDIGILLCSDQIYFPEITMSNLYN